MPLIGILHDLLGYQLSFPTLGRVFPRAIPVLQAGIPEIGILHHPGRTGVDRVVVVCLQNITKGGHQHCVWIACVLENDLGIVSVRIHPHPEAPDVKTPVMTGLPNTGRVVTVVGTGVDPATVCHCYIRPRVAVVHIPFSARARHDGVQGMVMGSAVESLGNNHLTVDLRIKGVVSVDVGVDMNVRSHRHDDDIIENADPHRFRSVGRTKELHGVGPAVVVSVREDLDAGVRHIRLAGVLQILSHPHAPSTVHVHGHWAVDHVGAGP